jgi:signal transduction histidine kinase
MPPLSELVAVPDGAVSNKHLLGTLQLSRVPDHGVDVDLVRTLMQREGLDPSMIPAEPKPVHVFGRACRAIETRRTAVGAKTRREQVDVREVLTNSAESVYQVTRVVVDEGNRVIDHPKAMRVVFDPTPRTIRAEPLESQHYDALRGLEDAIRESYKSNLGKITGAKVREVMRKVLRECHATPWTNAAYFTPIEFQGRMQALHALVKGLYGDDGEFTIIPMLNSKALREELDRHHTRAVQAEATELMAEISERLKTPGNVRQEMVATKLAARKQLGEKRNRMAELIGRETDAINEAVRMLDEQLEALMERQA